jgi:DNA repair ATPase RecN
MVRFPKAYTMVIDEQVKAMAIKDISTCGADEFVTKACVRLDCSRIKDDMRMMQTIGTPYQYEVSRTLHGINYALEQGWIDENKRDEYVSKLVALHKRNLKYEEDNPPIVYDKKKGLKKTTRTTRKKAKEATIEGFEKPKKEKAPSAAQLNAQARAKLISKLKINI